MKFNKNGSLTASYEERMDSFKYSSIDGMRVDTETGEILGPCNVFIHVQRPEVDVRGIPVVKNDTSLSLKGLVVKPKVKKKIENKKMDNQMKMF